MRRVLHVGCGIAQLPPWFEGWSEVRVDIDLSVSPDIVASITCLHTIADATFDAIWSSHNLEHLEAHQVPAALREFRRVLGPGGFALIAVPDLQTVAELVARGQLEEPCCDTPSGPVSPIDILYGFRPALRDGKATMAHRTGFTMRSLAEHIRSAGFVEAAAMRKRDTAEIWAEARTIAGEPNALHVLDRLLN